MGMIMWILVTGFVVGGLLMASSLGRRVRDRLVEVDEAYLTLREKKPAPTRKVEQENADRAERIRELRNAEKMSAWAGIFAVAFGVLNGIVGLAMSIPGAVSIVGSLLLLAFGGFLVWRFFMPAPYVAHPVEAEVAE